MADIKSLTVNDTEYTIKDDLSRKHLAWYGTCTVSGATTTKTVTCANYVLDTGSTIDVKFSNENSAAVASLKLNVNSTGARNIKYKGANLPSADLIGEGSVLRFIYDGTNYEIVGGIDNSNAYVASSQGVSHAGDFLVVNSQGVVEPVTMAAWQGGSY